MSSLRAYHATDLMGTHIPMHPGVVIVSLDAIARYEAGERNVPGLGTTGPIASDSAGNRYIVTAMHNVLSKTNTVKIGDEVVFLSKEAGTGKPKITKVGSVAKMGTFKPIPTNMPATAVTSPTMHSFDIVLLRPLLPVSYEVPGVGIQKAHVEPRIGMSVKKVGISTGIKSGKVIANPKVVAGAVCSPLAPKLLACIAVNDLFTVNIPGVAGDSGGPITTDTGQVLGVTIMGGNVTTAIKASSIARRFGVSFAGDSKVYNPKGWTGKVVGTAPPAVGLGSGSVPSDPIAALIQAIIDFINSLLTALTSYK